MLQGPTDDTIDPEIDNIDVAAGILRDMFRELESLEVDCARLHFAMCSTRHATRRELDLLRGIADLLKSGRARSRVRELAQRAKMLIFKLAAELEQFSVQTERHLPIDHLSSLPLLAGGAEASIPR
jgi:hypothetical protein